MTLTRLLLNSYISQKMAMRPHCRDNHSAMGGRITDLIMHDCIMACSLHAAPLSTILAFLTTVDWSHPGPQPPYRCFVLFHGPQHRCSFHDSVAPRDNTIYHLSNTKPPHWDMPWQCFSLGANSSHPRAALPLVIYFSPHLPQNSFF